jgi:HEPN domain-containing protein
LDTICFHIQQAAEKLLKAALAAQGVEYPFTHDLRDLLELALETYPQLERFRVNVPEYTEFAVRLRFDDLPWLTSGEASEAYEVIRDLRHTLHGLIHRS